MEAWNARTGQMSAMRRRRTSAALSTLRTGTLHDATVNAVALPIPVAPHLDVRKVSHYTTH